MQIKNEPDFKFLPKKRLIALLEQLPDDTVLRANTIGNLTVHKAAPGEMSSYDGNTCLYLMGYIDFRGEGSFMVIK